MKSIEMKDTELIQTIVESYYRQHKDRMIDSNIEDLLKISLNIDIDCVLIEGKHITVIYGPFDDLQKITFRMLKDKLKIINTK